jgi:sulfite exporter TauE/SafE
MLKSSLLYLKNDGNSEKCRCYLEFLTRMFRRSPLAYIYGLVFCTSSCLPYIASYIAGIGADFHKGVIVTLVYNVGRITAYTLIGGLIGVFSSVFRFAVDESSLAPFQQYSSYAFGAVTIIIGITILLKSRSASHDCNPEYTENPSVKKAGGRFDLRAFSLGFSRGLIVCPPLALLLVYSVPFVAPIDSFAVAVLARTIQKVALLGRRRNACSIRRSHLGKHNFFPAYMKGERLISF